MQAVCLPRSGFSDLGSSRILPIKATGKSLAANSPNLFPSRKWTGIWSSGRLFRLVPEGGAKFRMALILNNFLNFQPAQNGKNARNAVSWYVIGTRIFSNLLPLLATFSWQRAHSRSIGSFALMRPRTVTPERSFQSRLATISDRDDSKNSVFRC